MSRYRRLYIPGGTYFFSVYLADRQSSALIDEIALLRDVFRAVKQERSFAMDAMVILPDHLHAVWTLPPGDADFSIRWKKIKTAFSMNCQTSGRPSQSKSRKAKRASGNAGSGNTRFVIPTFGEVMSGIAETIRSGTVW